MTRTLRGNTVKHWKHSGGPDVVQAVLQYIRNTTVEQNYWKGVVVLHLTLMVQFDFIQVWPDHSHQRHHELRRDQLFDLSCDQGGQAGSVHQNYSRCGEAMMTPPGSADRKLLDSPNVPLMLEPSDFWAVTSPSRTLFFWFCTDWLSPGLLSGWALADCQSDAAAHMLHMSLILKICDNQRCWVTWLYQWVSECLDLVCMLLRDVIGLPCSGVALDLSP